VLREEEDTALDSSAAKTFIDNLWDKQIVPELADYIRIPAKSPDFDPEWSAHGHIDAAVEQFTRWARGMTGKIAGATLDVIRLGTRTPVIFIDIPGGSDDTVLLYGHLDKQPEMTGWSEGLGPWTPVLKNGRLYGRGGADDGYAMFASLAGILALRAQGLQHARCVVMIEASEESSSCDLPAYVEHLAPRLRSPSLVICLDSGCANYEQLWLTTSLRGVLYGVLTVQVLDVGVHSGDASGIVASSFRILRSILSRLEDETTGKIRPEIFHAEIPAERVAQAKASAGALGSQVYTKFPFVPGMRPMNEDPCELILNRTWRPALSVTGLAGTPPIASAGSVLRPSTSAKLSLRLPPTLNAAQAMQRLETLLKTDPPYGAKVEFEPGDAGSGWNAPPLANWLKSSIEKASQIGFGASAGMMGDGGSIPFMGMLGKRFTEAQFVVSGVLGPHSNAHGPNEFLHIAMGKGVTLAVAQILADHAAR